MRNENMTAALSRNVELSRRIQQQQMSNAFFGGGSQALPLPTRSLSTSRPSTIARENETPAEQSSSTTSPSLNTETNNGITTFLASMGLHNFFSSSALTKGATSSVNPAGNQGMMHEVASRQLHQQAPRRVISLRNMSQEELSNLSAQDRRVLEEQEEEEMRLMRLGNGGIGGEYGAYTLNDDDDYLIGTGSPFSETGGSDGIGTLSRSSSRRSQSRSSLVSRASSENFNDSLSRNSSVNEFGYRKSSFNVLNPQSWR
jgi:hypothetical protein